jgi:hypothetical protein
VRAVEGSGRHHTRCIGTHTSARVGHVLAGGDAVDGGCKRRDASEGGAS